MPSSLTHSYFAIDVYNKLDNVCKNKIKNLDYLKIFAQGPDLLYFFNSLTKGNMKIRKLGSYCHKHKTKDFFVNLVTNIKEDNLQNNSEVMSFLYGYISHFVLDSVVHPFVYYKTGIFDKCRKETYKYNGLHGEMEYYLDVYMIFQKEKMEAKYFKGHKYFKKITSFDSNLASTIDKVFFETYNEKDVSSYFLKGIKGLRIIYKYIKYDRFGIKKIFYRLLDFFSSSSSNRKEILSYAVRHDMKLHYLNLEKKTWNHPAYINETYDYSFIELYIIALNKAVKMIEEIVRWVDNKNNSVKELNVIFKNVSYLTGKDCEDTNKMQYFEF